MGFFEIFIVGIGLSMDAFAVSICKGLSMQRFNWLHAFTIALFFGVFQGIMPVIGWLLGASFSAYIEPFDHWIAFLLLAFIGAKMVWDSIFGDGGDEGDEERAEDGDRLDITELLMLAVATSIDALAVGISFAFLGVNIGLAALTIGITTFALSLLGVGIGRAFGSRFERISQIIGGVVLILIGFKILFEHLGLIGF